MNFAQVVFFIFVLILISLLIRYYKGTAEVLRTGGGVVVKTISTLQSPGPYPK